MEKITAATVRVGMAMAQPLYRRNGQKLIEAGTTLRAEHVRLVGEAGDEHFYLATCNDELAKAGVIERVDVASSLEEGQAVERPMMSRWGRVLLEAGQVVEAHHVRAGSEGVYVAAADAPQPTELADLLVKLTISALGEAMADDCGRIERQPQDVWETRKIESGGPWPGEAALAERRAEEVALVERWFDRLLAGGPLKMGDVATLLHELYERLLNHRSRFTQLALLCSRRTNHLPDHGYSVAVLAMATAANLN